MEINVNDFLQRGVKNIDGQPKSGTAEGSPETEQRKPALKRNTAGRCGDSSGLFVQSSCGAIVLGEMWRFSK